MCWKDTSSLFLCCFPTELSGRQCCCLPWPAWVRVPKRLPNMPVSRSFRRSRPGFRLWISTAATASVLRSSAGRNPMRRMLPWPTTARRSRTVRCGMPSGRSRRPWRPIILIAMRVRRANLPWRPTSGPAVRRPTCSVRLPATYCPARLPWTWFSGICCRSWPFLWTFRPAKRFPALHWADSAPRPGSISDRWRFRPSRWPASGRYWRAKFSPDSPIGPFWCRSRPIWPWRFPWPAEACIERRSLRSNWRAANNTRCRSTLRTNGSTSRSRARSRIGRTADRSSAT